MSVLMPDLASALRERATEMARAEHARRERRRRWWMRGGGSLSVLLVFGASATALGLWDPPLGSDPASPPKSSQAAPSAAAREEVAVLRRSQTTADRGAASRYALRFPASADTTIFTSSVRLMGETTTGQPVVLVPQRGPRGEVLCLWVGTPAGSGQAGGQRVCTATRDALGGGLVLASGSSAELSTQVAELRRRLFEEAQARGTPVQSSPELEALMRGGVSVVGLAPDSASRATVAGVTASVRGNLFELTLPRETGRLRADFP